MVSVAKYSEIVEMYKFCPIKVTKDRNKSNEIYYQTLSKKASALDKSAIKKPRDPNLAHLITLLHYKISERFTKLADAFRFFDSSNDGFLSL